MCFVLGCTLFILSCRDRVRLDRSALLEYSSDTILLDTIISDMGTRTRQWKIFNRSEGRIQIDNISLQSGTETQYIVNVDGQMVGNGVQRELRPGDSLFLFVQAKLKESGTDTALLRREFLSVSYNSRTDNIPIISYGQDVYKLYGQSIGTQRWSGKKPFLIFDSLHIQAGQTLTISEGVTVFCHAGARIIADGGLVCEGTMLQPVVFKSDNWDTSYYDIPNQWGSIILRDSMAQYRFSHTRMLRGTNGLIAKFGSMNSASQIIIENSEILYMGSAGIVAENTNLICSNTVIGNCSAYALIIGGIGSYRIVHSTLAKMNAVFSESVPLLTIKHPKQPGLSVNVANSIIVSSQGNTKSRYSEISITDSLGADILFEQCIISVDAKQATDPHFVGCYVRQDTSRIFKYDSDPIFLLDSVSVARDYGLPGLMGDQTIDRLGNARNVDSAPDAGAYEYFQTVE